jgi:hypothetical protein
MLLNFVLHSSIQERCGVDLTKFFPEEVIAEDNIQKERKGKESAMGIMDSLCNGFAYVTLSGPARNALGHGKSFRTQKQKI